MVYTQIFQRSESQTNIDFAFGVGKRYSWWSTCGLNKYTVKDVSCETRSTYV